MLERPDESRQAAAGPAAADLFLSLRADYLVCKHLVRACQQAIYEISQEAADPEAARQAQATMRAILDDWSAAQRYAQRRLKELDPGRRTRALPLTTR
jgi:hypothetical protein